MNIAIIMAGGTGKRMNSDIPKQFLTAGGKPVIIHTLEKFQAAESIDAVTVVCAEGYIGYCRELVDAWNITKCLSVIPGGAERYDSSRKGVEEALRIAKSLKTNEPDVTVLIHDAARPFIGERIINENIANASALGACETVSPMNDTVIRGKDGFAEAVVDREDLFKVQTPQSFRLDVIKEAFERYDPAVDGPVTDDASLVLRLGGKVALVNGSPLNIKITTPEDLGFFR